MDSETLKEQLHLWAAMHQAIADEMITVADNMGPTVSLPVGNYTVTAKIITDNTARELPRATYEPPGGGDIQAIGRLVKHDFGPDGMGGPVKIIWPEGDEQIFYTLQEVRAVFG